MKKNLDLKIAIIRNGFTQRRLASIVGMHETMLSRIINGRENPNPDEELKIAMALGHKERELFPRGNK